VANIATTVAVITAVASHPAARKRRPITLTPITRGLAASSIITAMIGTAITPLINRAAA